MRLLHGLVFVAFALAACGGQPFTAAAPDGGVDASAGDTGACVPKTCPELHWLCGDGGDGCGGTLSCGGCSTAGFSCGVDHACRCRPKSCAQQGFECGSAPDGCGAVQQCPPCTNGATCGGGGDHKCGTQHCTPKSCQEQNAHCGTVSDGCSASLNCGFCTPPDSCGGSGQANQCGCTPKTCKEMGWMCGSGVEDGCNTPLDCQGCSGGGQCQNHLCGPCTPLQTCASNGYTCGSFVDDCNVTQRCGPAPVPSSGSDACSALDPAYPYAYACSCVQGQKPTSNPPIQLDGGVGSCGSGPSPSPVPGWRCVSVPGSTDSWCCDQPSYK